MIQVEFAGPSPGYFDDRQRNKTPHIRPMLMPAQPHGKNRGAARETVLRKQTEAEREAAWAARRRLLKPTSPLMIGDAMAA